MRTHNNINVSLVKQKQDYFYKVSNFLDSLPKQSELYTSFKAFIKAAYYSRKRQWARKYIAVQTGLHVDTISAHTVQLEKAGFISVIRKFKNNNIFDIHHLDVLAVLFGYLKSALLFTLLINFNLSSNNIESKTSFEKLEISQKKENKGISGDILQLLSKFKITQPTNIVSVPTSVVSVPRKPYKNEILYCENPQSSHNMNLVFKYTDVVADLPFGKYMKQYKSQEDHLAEIKTMTVSQAESAIWRNPLNNQVPYYKKEAKKYTEVEKFEQTQKYKSLYLNPPLKPHANFMEESLEVLKRLMEKEKSKV